MAKKASILLFLVSFCIQIAFSQGCSDAGFCTMGAMKPDQPFARKIKLRLRSIEMGLYQGKTNLEPIIYVFTGDLNFSLNAKNSFQVKVPYQAVKGELANTDGLGDFSLSYTHTIFSTEKFDINATLGGKIASNNGNLKKDGKPLPMYYQTSLGTYDLVAGISLLSRNWLLATGIQHPFNPNGNQFVWGAWADFPDQETIRSYPKSKDLRRGTDIMIRVERNFRYSRYNLSIGLLPIYRINKDIITDPRLGRVKLEGSTGLALTGLVTFGYSFNVRSSVKFLYGKKFTNRKMEPDGLTRRHVITLSYIYRF